MPAGQAFFLSMKTVQASVPEKDGLARGRGGLFLEEVAMACRENFITRVKQNVAEKEERTLAGERDSLPKASFLD